MKKSFSELSRNIVFSFYFLLEKNKRLIKYIFKKFSKSINKSVDINLLIKSGHATSYTVFKGEIYTLRGKPDINNKEFKYLPKGKYNIPNYKIYTIKNGLVKAGTNNIFSEDGRKITGINFQEMNLDFKIINNLKNIKIKNLDGTLLLLGIGIIETNYSHAWTELAARAYASKISKIKYDHILIDNKTKFIEEILKLLGIPVQKIIYSFDYDFIKAKKIIYPELINNYKEYFLNGVFVYHRKYLPYWIKFLYKDISNKVSINLKYDFEKIYISRKNKKERFIVNELELVRNLSELGFKKIYFEDFSVKEQIRIMCGVKQIVAIHGAGLVNINFCNKRTKILEVFPFNYQCAFFYMQANMCDLNYDYYIADPVNKLFRRSPIMEDLYVDVNKIKEFIMQNWK